MTEQLSKTTMLVLAALYEAMQRVKGGPFADRLQLCAVLWLLYQRSDRSRTSHSDFWKVVTSEQQGTQFAHI